MPGHKLTANMPKNNFVQKRNAKIRMVRKHKGRLSDNTVNNRQAAKLKVMKRQMKLKAKKAAFKDASME